MRLIYTGLVLVALVLELLIFTQVVRRFKSRVAAAALIVLFFVGNILLYAGMARFLPGPPA